ncbi:uncharacterized protein CYBJADRAFT_70971 [Cyberlindnera jadinii NRRL Y-1542]|uniref:Cas12f1-like TNB domain-containing protein n=1 Tax=Cyberlindnera jadinii (strain ATCC 18201 / CBS 1600 / BCRC 20928 / JCM 3617 / NBRC 0987 / NRRL Y-1542) TaxID=983966 RepID=A0A1E4S4C1_CYBJN|nr:hypothetical protein CYBJADRAFT_70971 [Cyberlindnera jadinii NRRL Y-1542]ODV74242.1 hypothetical protein CYBJADRAFT_70971 [Cyberlindnera jadinii NRRL Y-1542]
MSQCRPSTHHQSFTQLEGLCLSHLVRARMQPRNTLLSSSTSTQNTLVNCRILSSSSCCFSLIHQRLAFKCQVKRTRLSRVTEEYTCKVCTGCGTIKDTLSLANRTFRCALCNLFVDRYVNGARNILIKCLVASQ